MPKENPQRFARWPRRHQVVVKAPETNMPKLIKFVDNYIASLKPKKNLATSAIGAMMHTREKQLLQDFVDSHGGLLDRLSGWINPATRFVYPGDLYMALYTLVLRYTNECYHECCSMSRAGFIRFVETEGKYVL